MDQEKIGKFILKLRKEKDLTQADLAGLLNVTDRAISNWENGRRMPDVSFYKPLCEVFNITVSELLNGEKIPKMKLQEKSDKIIVETISKNKKEKIKFGTIIKVLIVIVIIFSITTVSSYVNRYPEIDMNTLYLGHLDPGFKLDMMFSYHDTDVYYYGVDNVQVCNKHDLCVELKNALVNKQISLEELHNFYIEQSGLGHVSNSILMDGGTSIYKSDGYAIMFCKTIDGNRDLYIGNPDMVEKLNGNYCGHEEFREKYFIRTYKILESSIDKDDEDFINVLLMNNSGEKARVKVNINYDLVVGKWYEFTFYAYEKFPDKISNIFKNATIMDINLGDEVFDLQVNDDIYFNKLYETDVELNELEHVKMDIVDGSLSNVGAKVEITDMSGNKYVYGASYRIDKKINGRWEELPKKCNNCMWNMMAYGPDLRHKLVFDYNWNELYGELEKGEYRLVKEAALENKRDLKELYISVEFEIK